MNQTAEKKPNRGWFTKGRSGNPRGRPKAATPDASHAFDIILDRTLSVTTNGVQRDVTMEEALQLKTYQEAVAGKRLAQKQVLKWIEKREAWLAKHRAAAKPSQQVIFTGMREDPSNADVAMFLLGIAGYKPNGEKWFADRMQLLLEPWAVEAAFKRRRNAKPLEEQDLDSIRRCTRDARTISALCKSRRNG